MPTRDEYIDTLLAQYNQKDEDDLVRIGLALDSLYEDGGLLVMIGMAISLGLAFEHPEYAQRCHELLFRKIIKASPKEGLLPVHELLMQMVPLDIYDAG